MRRRQTMLACMVRRRSTVRFRNGAPGGLHVLVGPIFTFASDIPASWQPVVRCRGLGRRGGAWFPDLSRVRACFRLLVAAVLVVTGAGLVVAAAAGQGGPAGRPARVLRRRLRVFGGSPAAARCWFSSCRVFQACRIRWLRTMSRVVTNSIKGARPIRRHQPRLMSLLAGSLAVAKPRSAPVRRL